MIKLEVKPCTIEGEEGSAISCSINGNLEQIITETKEAIQAIYRGMFADEKDPIPMFLFRAKIAAAVNDPNSALWNLNDENVTDIKCEEGKEGPSC